MSLANEMHLSSTGLEGLLEMSERLKEICLSNEGACVQSKTYLIKRCYPFRVLKREYNFSQKSIR